MVWAKQTTKPIKADGHESLFMPGIKAQAPSSSHFLEQTVSFLLQILYGALILISFLNCFTFGWRENSGVHRRHCHSGDDYDAARSNLPTHRTKATMTPLNRVNSLPRDPKSKSLEIKASDSKSSAESASNSPTNYRVQTLPILYFRTSMLQCC